MYVIYAKDSAGIPIANANLVAYAHPDSTTLREIPDGGEYELTPIATATSNADGRAIIYLNSLIDLEELLNGDSYLNFTVLAANDTTYGRLYTRAFINPRCIGNPDSEVGSHEAETVTLDADLPVEAKRTLRRATNSVDGWDPGSYRCWKNDIGNRRVDVGRAYNHSTTGATLTFRREQGATTTVGSAVASDLSGAIEWQQESAREMRSGASVPYPTLTGEQRAAVFQTDMRFADSGCQMTSAGFEYFGFRNIEATDYSGGNPVVFPSDPAPSFSDQNCVTYYGDEPIVIESSRAETFTEGVKFGTEYSGLSLTSQTGYNQLAAIEVSAGLDGSGSAVPYDLCGLHAPPEAQDTDPGLFLVRDTSEYPPPGYSKVEAAYLDERACVLAWAEGVERGYWGFDYLCLKERQAPFTWELWVKYL